jgi:hypothetical protein
MLHAEPRGGAGEFGADFVVKFLVRDFGMKFCRGILKKKERVRWAKRTFRKW